MIGTLDMARSRLEHSPLARRFLSGAAWSVLGTVISSSLTLLMLMLVARFLGRESYGQFVVIQSTLGMVGVFAGFGIGAAATRYAAELRFRDATRLGHILTLAERTVLVFGLFASLGLVIGSGWMAAHLLNAPGLQGPLAIAAVAVFFTALDSYQKSVLIGFEAMRAFATGTVVGVMVGFPIMLLAASQYGLTGVAVVMVVNAFVQVSISRYQMARELRKFSVKRNAKGCLSEWPILWHFAIPALLVGAMVSPAHWVVQALLANTPNGYAELAVLGIAMQWFNIIMFVPGTAGRVVLPILTDYVASRDYGNSRKILLYAMGANALIAIPLAMIIGLFSSYIMSMYGKSFENDCLPLVVAVITAALLAIQTPVGNLLVASSRMWLGALMNAGWGLIYVSSAYILLDKGATGVTIALALGYIAHAIWTFWFALRHKNGLNNKQQNIG